MAQKTGTGKPRLYAEASLCKGCDLCVMTCSFTNSGQYHRDRSRIRIFRVRDDGVDIPLIDCDPETVPRCRERPQCVYSCPTGSLVYEERDAFALMLAELEAGRRARPSYKVRAPWTAR